MVTRHGHFNFGEENPPRSTYHSQGKFGRLFPSLPPFAADTPTMREALNDIGQAGGIMDANDDMSDPITSITDPTKSLNNPDNPDLSAGFTFLGQFLDHDLTFDPTSSLERQQDPEAIANFRTPLLELDSVYGSGPNPSPHLYDRTVQDERKFYIEEIPNSATKTRDGSTKFDLPRNGQLTALIGDPRNDENLIVSQLQLAFLKFHNAAADFVRTEIPDLTTPGERFAEAQRLVRWHYQWIIVHEFLPKTCGQEVVDDVLQNGRKFYGWNKEPFIPVEFSVGSYRFGHSQVRPSYRANFGAFDGDEFFAFIFIDDRATAMSPDPDDLRGGKRATRRFIDWQTFFDFGDGWVRSNKRIDTTCRPCCSICRISPPTSRSLWHSATFAGIWRSACHRAKGWRRRWAFRSCRGRILRICSHTVSIRARRFGSMSCARPRSWLRASGWGRSGGES
jgi:Animal haem peroxidase